MNIEEVLCTAELNPEKITEIPYSTSTMNFKLDFQNEKPLLLKIYRGREDGYEFKLMKKLYAKGISVPKQIFFHNRSKKLPSFLVMEYIEGTILGNEMTDSGKMHVEKYIKTLRQIHEYDWKRPDLDIKKYYPKSNSFAKSIVKRRKEENKRLKLKKETKEVTRWMEQRCKQITTSDYRQLHGDYHPYNMVLRDEKLVVFDWEGAEIADIRYDLGFATLALGIVGGNDIEQKAIEIYNGLTGNNTLDDMDFFEVTGAMHRVTKLHRMFDSLPEIHRRAYYYLKERIEEISGKIFELQ